MSNDQSQFPRDKILKIIDDAKKFVKGKRIDTLRQFADGYRKEYYRTKPGKLSLNSINPIRETAYQRAIFSLEKAKLNTIGDVVWIDIELPVVFNKSRRRKCVD